MENTSISVPLVTVIMPAHNAAKFLAEAIISVQSQTWTQWELLILDDASTDNTLALAEGFAQYDPRIKVFSLASQGSPSKVRNVGLNKVSGEYIAFLDSDDRYLPDNLTQLLQGFKQYPNATAVYGFADLMDEHGIPTEEGLRLVPDAQTGQLAVPSYYSHDWPFLLRGGLSCMLPGLLIKKETLNRVGLLEERFIAAEDYQFYMRLMFDSHDNVHYLPLYAYQYRVYGGSLTKTPEKATHIMQSVLDVMTWVFDQPQLPEAYRPMRAVCLTHCYRYLIRERIINNQPALARQMVWHAYGNPAITRLAWAKLCGPLLLRSYLPTTINNRLKHWKEKRRLQQERLLLQR